MFVSGFGRAGHTLTQPGIGKNEASRINFNSYGSAHCSYLTKASRFITVTCPSTRLS